MNKLEQFSLYFHRQTYSLWYLKLTLSFSDYLWPGAVEQEGKVRGRRHQILGLHSSHAAGITLLVLVLEGGLVLIFLKSTAKIEINDEQALRVLSHENNEV